MTSTHKTKWIYTLQDIVSYNCSSKLKYHFFSFSHLYFEFMNGLLYLQKHKYKVANQRAKQALEMVC